MDKFCKKFLARKIDGTTQIIPLWRTYKQMCDDNIENAEKLISIPRSLYVEYINELEDSELAEMILKSNAPKNVIFATTFFAGFICGWKEAK